MSYSPSVFQRLMSHTALASIAFVLTAGSSAHADLLLPAVTQTSVQLVAVDTVATSSVLRIISRVGDPRADTSLNALNSEILVFSPELSLTYSREPITIALPDQPSLVAIPMNPAPVEPPFTVVNGPIPPAPVEPPFTVVNGPIPPAPVEPPFTVVNGPVPPAPVEPPFTVVNGPIPPAPVEPPFTVVNGPIPPAPVEPPFTVVNGPIPPAPVEPPFTVVNGPIPPAPVEPPFTVVNGPIPPAPVEPPFTNGGGFRLPNNLPNFAESLNRGPLERFFASLRDAILLNDELTYSQGFFTSLDGLGLSILSDGSSQTPPTVSANLSPEQLGELSPAAGGIAGNTTVNCANAYFQNGWNPDANLGDCSVDSGNNL